MTIAEQTKQMRLQRIQEKIHIKEQKQLSILREQEIKKEQEQNHINLFIKNNFDITKNIKDKIQSSILNEKINNSFSSFINAEKVKNNVLKFDGIICKKTKGYMFYCGLKEKNIIVL